jgi:phage shock protein A
MSDLLKKLNTLIQAGINDVMDEAQKAVSEPMKHLPRTRLGKEIDNEVGHLRRKVNEALTYEDELVVRIAELEQEVATLDRQADEAVAAGNDAQARYLIDRLTRAQQRVTMTQSDLEAHRLAAQELILRVNELDAAVADARHAEQGQSQQAEVSPQTIQPDSDIEREIPVKVKSPASDTEAPTTSEEVVKRMQAFNEEAGKVLSDVLRDARQKIEQMDTLIASTTQSEPDLEPSVTEQVEEVIKEDVVADDIAARRARLARPAKPDDTERK